MTNEERIKLWRKRREEETAAQQQFPEHDRAMAAIAARVEPLVRTKPLVAEELLTVALAVLRPAYRDSNAARRKVYDMMALGLERAGQKRTLSTDLIVLQGRQLRILVRLLEADLRDGLDIYTEGYRPVALEEANTRLEHGYQRRLQRAGEEAVRFARRRAAVSGEAFAVNVLPDENDDLIHIRRRLAASDATRGVQAGHRTRLGIRALVALFRHQLKLLNAESRLAVLWAFVGPAVLLSLISSLYLLSGSRYILNMDVPTFSMLGATVWIMFRNIIFRTSTGLYANRALLNLQPITPVAIALSQGALYMLIYAVVFVILICGGHEFAIFSLPHDWAGFCGWIIAMAIAGMAVGVLFGSIAVIWPFFLRLAPIIERTLQIFSSVFFVSEQLPEQYRAYLLWSPFAHALQLLRSAYFINYKSDDANPKYFFIWLAALAISAFAAQRAVRSRSQPM